MSKVLSMSATVLECSLCDSQDNLYVCDRCGDVLCRDCLESDDADGPMCSCKSAPQKRSGYVVDLERHNVLKARHARCVAALRAYQRANHIHNDGEAKLFELGRAALAEEAK